MKDKSGFETGKIALVCLLATCLTSVSWAQSSFSYSEDSGAVVVHYSRTPGELALPDPSTTVTVYGDGRVVVHYPPYGARKGDYEVTLSKAELDELVASVVNSGMLEYDGAAVAAEQQALLTSQNMGHYIGDADISRIEIHLTAYGAAGEPTRADVRREITVSGLQLEARQFPSIQSLASLATAERKLLELTTRENLSALR